MNFREALAREHSKTLSQKIAKNIGDDPEKFAELVKILLGKETELAQRAAWAFNFTALEKPYLLAPHLAALIQKLESPGSHPAVYRNIYRVFQDYRFPEKYHAVLFDLSMRALRGETQPVAIRAFAMSLAANVARTYPELRYELQLCLNDMLAYPQPPAIIARAKKVRKVLKSTL
ncbi:MAG TPA: hypothetical protein PLQ93_06880 [Bacteroidia bacterium]|nr:hypothetical protein [Bacteroidia bacterium]